MICRSLLALALLAAAPAATPTPKARPAPATSPAKVAPKATPKPKATATANAVATPDDEPAVMDGERKLAKGVATYKLGDRAMELSEVRGAIQTSGGFKIASLQFVGAKTERLQIDVMFTAPGPVEQGYVTALYAIDEDGKVSAFKKGVGQCSVTLAKATAVAIEGTASCPKGMLDLQDRPAKPITEVKFSVEADVAAAKTE